MNKKIKNMLELKVKQKQKTKKQEKILILNGKI